MNVERYVQGQKARFEVVFDDAVAGLVDPGAVKFRYSIDSGSPNELTYGVDAALVKVSTGSYRVDLDLDTPGRMRWRWLSTGNAQAATQGVIVIEPAAP